ncbi:glutaminyl-peptide cyclotransferase [Akkermansiaceae bacterium]|nr:glutaminyl-peptide cyclotransferase [Akkermansiaceae bacterium]
MKFRIFAAALLALSSGACQKKAQGVNQVKEPAEAPVAPDWKAHPMLGYEVLRELPHDTGAFTQGLLLSHGDWIETTGGYGTSSIRRVEKETGKVLRKRDLPANFFGEGVADLDGKLHQLTWHGRQGFLYDTKTLEPLGNFRYDGEGWGLTSDGASLVMSDGSDRLRFLDPKTFRVWRELRVRLNGKPVNLLNELEFIEGEIFANVWHSDFILRINPKDGTVLGVIDLTGIDAKSRRLDPEHVLNGIAYDPQSRELFVTGKCWPKIYQIRLIPKQ